jgi:hypothetical protein
MSRGAPPFREVDFQKPSVYRGRSNSEWRYFSGRAYDGGARNVMPTVVVLIMATPTLVMSILVMPATVAPTMGDAHIGGALQW